MWVSRYNSHFPLSSWLPLEISIIVGSFVLIFLVFRLTTIYKKSGKVEWGSAFLLAGTYFNLAERLLTGQVFDYLNFFGLFAFNLADALITVGCIMLILKLWKTYK